MRPGTVVRQVPLALRLALREMRGGLKGFYIFLACIALGTAAIAGVNSVASAITQAIASQGQALLAGDVRFEFNNRFATPEERAYFEGLGDVSLSTGLRSMVRLPDGSDQTLVETKGVDGAYPLYGAVETEPKLPTATLLARTGDAYGAVVAPLLLDRLGVAVGDEILLGTAKLKITATLVREPDAVSEGFGFAPRLMLSQDALQASGLVQTGSLVENAYRIRIGKDTKPLDPNIQKLQDDLSEKLGATVQIQHSGSGKGKVVVSYHSLDELDGILAHIH